MVSSLLLLVAPFSLFLAASAQSSSVYLSPGEEFQVSCKGETVTKTVWLSAETSSPVSTEAPTVAVTTVSQAPLPTATASLGTNQTVAVSVNVTAPSTNTPVKTASGYRNALYFTNWFVICAKERVSD
jgi:hypothetical protein